MKNATILIVGTTTFDTQSLALLLRRDGHTVTEVQDTDTAVAAFHNDIAAPYHFVITPSRIGPMPIDQFLTEASSFGVATILFYGGAFDENLARRADICIGQCEKDTAGHDSYQLLFKAIEEWNPSVVTA